MAEWQLAVDATLAAAAATAAGLAPAGWQVATTSTHPAGPPALVTWFTRDPPAPIPPPPPAPTGMTPDTGPIAGGTNCTIDGSGFTGATGATLGGAPVSTFNVLSDASIFCLTPPHAVGAAALVVNHPNGPGTLANAFTYT